MKKNHLKEVILHPSSIKEISRGHCWITPDQFTKKFPKQESFLIGTDQNRKIKIIFFHDPYHPKIVGRVWKILSSQKLEKENLDFDFDFEKELIKRLQLSFEKREALSLDKERENYYLAFGESDALPGLFILKLKDHILIQFYSDFWRNWEKKIAKNLRKILKNESQLWIQYRVSGASEKKGDQEIPRPDSENKKSHSSFIVQEFGVSYQIKLDSYYDHGLYSDISSVRKKIGNYFAGVERFLNLYSYTGAFSLYAQKMGAKEIYSVDNSNKYLDWFSQNIELNSPQLKRESHHLIKEDVSLAIKQFIKKKMTFDFIVSDPPSFSHGRKGKNGDNHGDNIVSFLKDISPILSPQGKILLFSNTHSVKREKIREKIADFLGQQKKMVILEEFFLDQDCSRVKGLPESDYLKGFLIGNHQAQKRLIKP